MQKIVLILLLFFIILYIIILFDNFVKNSEPDVLFLSVVGMYIITVMGVVLKYG